MLEIEVKYRVADRPAFERLREKLIALGAQPSGTRRDADQYFNAPDRDFAQTDEALRLRSIGDENYITYKGPKRDTLTKTRQELEVPLVAGHDSVGGMAGVLTLLGYRPVATVHKTRHTFEFAPSPLALHACLDEVNGVGLFMELEVVADESDEEQARQLVLDMARQLGMPETTERRSYLALLLGAEVRS